MLEGLYTTGTFPEKARFNHNLRLKTVADILNEEAIRTILDLGCGDGDLEELLLENGDITKIVGIDNDIWRLQKAIKRFGGDDVERLEFFLSSFTNLDSSLAGCDAVTLVEAIEHIPEADLYKLELGIFETLRPKVAVVTTPNATQRLPQQYLDARGHMFEWDPSEFMNWGDKVSNLYPYTFEMRQLNGPTFERGTQIGIFRIQII